MSAARASPIQRRGRTTGAVRGAKRGLSAIGSSTSKLGDEYAGVHQQPDAEQASDADRRIKERSHSPFARLPDHEPERDNNRQQQNGELRSPGREQRAGEAWPSWTCSSTGAKAPGSSGGSRGGPALSWFPDARSDAGAEAAPAWGASVA